MIQYYFFRRNGIETINLIKLYAYVNKYSM